MEKLTFEKIDETIYKEKLDSGLEIYLYPTKKTRNFYITISVKYGARVEKYKLNNNIFDIIPGSAHFLEHKVMAISENKEFSKAINKYGSFANAWTNYYGTNYNIYGSNNIKENIKLLLNIFYNTNINTKCVNGEKGIIGEEIDMNLDKIDNYMIKTLFNNLFNKSYIKNTVVGERTDIEKITADSLNKIYDDYYVPSNTFIGVYGNFKKEEIVDLIKEELKKYKVKNNTIPERIVDKDDIKVVKDYELIEKGIQNEKVKIGFKMPRSSFKMDNNDLLKAYLDLVLSSNFDTTSPLYERYKKENIIISIGYNINLIDDYVVIIFNALCEKSKVFIDNLLKDIKFLKVNKEEFDRKKNVYLRYYISSFDSIEDIEYDITMSLLVNGYIDLNEYSTINDMNIDKAKELLNIINFDNFSIVVCK